MKKYKKITETIVTAKKWDGKFTEWLKPYLSEFKVGDGHCTMCKHPLEKHGLVDSVNGTKIMICPGDWLIWNEYSMLYKASQSNFKKKYKLVELCSLWF